MFADIEFAQLLLMQA